MSPSEGASRRWLAAALREELERQAVGFSLHLDGFPENRPDRVYVLVDPQRYVAENGDGALPEPAILRRTIFLCPGPPPPSGDALDLALLRRAGAVFVLDQRSVVALRRAGIPARLMKPGYSAAFDRFDPAAHRPVDILFLGARSLRRTGHLSRAADVLARHHSVVRIWREGDGRPFAGDAARRGEELLGQSKVLMVVHADGDQGFEWYPALAAMHAGAVVVSEHSSGLAPLVAGEHLLLGSADALPFIAEGLLADPGRLAALRLAAHERLRTWMPFALPVSVLRAAIVELVGEPVPPEASLGKTGAGRVAGRRR